MNLGIFNKRDLLNPDVILVTHIETLSTFCIFRYGIHFKLIAGIEVKAVDGEKKLVEELAISFTIFPKVIPSLGNVGTGMKDYSPTIDNSTWRILFNDSHNTTNKLNKGRKISKNTEYRCDSKKRMVKSLS